ncbi:MAG: hypothetical protein JSS90_03375 [Bacteroidetes bacterium]|nr:hypothetical protein [Bacteroidota bacterium]
MADYSDVKHYYLGVLAKNGFPKNRNRLFGFAKGLYLYQSGCWAKPNPVKTGQVVLESALAVFLHLSTTPVYLKTSITLQK